MKIHSGLAIVESAFLALAIIGIVAVTIGGFSLIIAVIPLTFSLIFNQINRYHFAQQQHKSTAHLKKLFDHDRVILTELIEQLKTLQSSSPSWVLEQWHPNHSPEMTQPGVETETNHSLFPSLLERQVLLEQTVQKVQQEIEMVVVNFQRRPELEQIEHLTSVIVDLQQFINQLPQWGRLQQQQLTELRDRVESALNELSQEMAEIPPRVERVHPHSAPRTASPEPNPSDRDS
ncbi:hypothetical protein [Lyngbya sp. PCC 8106]|uniref:hypothetical protein n=1 Tax=Lyngbya sp. (strain PCC 8106) TaxID=313612 RepID=UPI0000EA8FBC|nr:hypothetical protein [Lyngbya sp. PCC 8106]EAW34507.1 hypothetical protein L8106_03504 [Lyngbya sp. PCC 8106]